MTALRRSLAALVWLLAAVAIAFGAAGLVTAMDAPPAGRDRPELTMRGDAVVTPALDTIDRELVVLSDDVDALGIQARGALGALGGNDMTTVDTAIAAGDALLLDIAVRVARIRAGIGAVPLIGTPAAGYEVSASVRDRFERLRAATTAVDGLDAAWVRLTTGSVAASRLSGLLAAHDEAVLAAAELGRDASYKKAAATLDAADTAITAARALSRVLSRTVDITVLDEWLDRSATYDVALRRLYDALANVGGRVTSTVRKAIAAEKAAKDRLPPDSRGLILIMSEIGRGGMSGAVISIEEARGALTEALEPPASPSGSPSPTPTGAP